MVQNDRTIFSLWRKHKKFSYLNLIVILVMSMALNLSASANGEGSSSPVDAVQEVTVSGIVTDASNNEPLPGVNIVISGTTTGTITDVDGRYSLRVPNANVTLRFSFVGYVSRNIPLAGQTSLNVQLASDIELLSEVVVVGYGTSRRADLTGAVSSVSAERLVDRPTISLGESMMGKIAGVHVIRAGGGEPGGRPMIRIRGISSVNTGLDPLFVVDGVVGVRDPLQNLNPNDIESIDVLKDASSSAIYGARAANGVIIITTKRGQSGRTQVEYRGTATLGTMQRSLASLNSEQMLYVYEQAMANVTKYGSRNRLKDFRGQYDGPTSYAEMPHIFQQVTPGSYTLDLIGNDGNYYAPRFDSNWEEIFYNNAISNSHFVDMRGGSEAARFSLSVGYNDQQGLMADSWMKRYTSRLTGDIDVSNWFDISTSLSYNKTEQTFNSGYRHAAEVWPIVPTKYPDDPDTYGMYAGRWGTNSDFNIGEQWFNPLFVRDQDVRRYYRDQVIGSAILNFQITEDLSFKSDFSVDMSFSKDNRYSGIYFASNPTAQIDAGNRRYWQNQNYFNYDKTFGDSHNVSAMVGLSWSEITAENVAAQNREFFTNFYGWSNLGAGGAARPGVSSSDSRSSLNSYFGRFNYNYEGKYLITMTGRIDGSSRFGTENKYAFFPSVGAAWRISEENFFNVDAITNLKLRGSMGQTGNQEIGNYVTQARVGALSSIIFDGRTAIGIYPTSMGNQNLKWETITQWDIGLDVDLFQNRVSVILDYYHRKTTDMLLSVPLPQSTTTGSVLMNYGSLENKGWEVEVHTRNIQTSDFNWGSNLTLYSNTNQVLQLGPTNAPIYRDTGAGNGTSVTMVGESMGAFFGLTRLGTWNTDEASEAARFGMVPGDLRFVDRNMDGRMDLISDGSVIGESWPKYIMGLNNTFRYKNWDASLDLAAVLKVDKAFVHESAEDRQLVSGGLNSTLQAWRPDQQESMVAQIRPGYGGAYYQSYPDTHMLYDGAFLRGNNATIGYTFESGRIGVQSLRVYFNANNFFIITKAKGYDPEGSSLDKQRAQIANIDKYQYPTPSNYSLGLNVNF